MSTLSGGQCQRLVVAAVLAEEPQVLVFDEPTSALDPEGIREFYEMVGELNQKEGLTVIVAEHHLEATLPYAKKFVLMNKGEIVSQGTPEEVMRDMKKTISMKKLFRTCIGPSWNWKTGACPLKTVLEYPGR